MNEIILCIQLITKEFKCQELKEIEYKQITQQELVLEYQSLEQEIEELNLDSEELGLMTKEEFLNYLLGIEKFKREYLEIIQESFDIVRENLKIQKIINGND